MSTASATAAHCAPLVHVGECRQAQAFADLGEHRQRRREAHARPRAAVGGAVRLVEGGLVDEPDSEPPGDLLERGRRLERYAHGSPWRRGPRSGRAGGRCRKRTEPAATTGGGFEIGHARGSIRFRARGSKRPTAWTSGRGQGAWRKLCGRASDGRVPAADEASCNPIVPKFGHEDNKIDHGQFNTNSSALQAIGEASTLKADHTLGDAAVARFRRERPLHRAVTRRTSFSTGSNELPAKLGAVIVVAKGRRFSRAAPSPIAGLDASIPVMVRRRPAALTHGTLAGLRDRPRSRPSANLRRRASFGVRPRNQGISNACRLALWREAGAWLLSRASDRELRLLRPRTHRRELRDTAEGRAGKRRRRRRPGERLRRATSPAWSADRDRRRIRLRGPVRPRRGRAARSAAAAPEAIRRAGEAGPGCEPRSTIVLQPEQRRTRAPALMVETASAPGGAPRSRRRPVAERRESVRESGGGRGRCRQAARGLRRSDPLGPATSTRQLLERPRPQTRLRPGRLREPALGRRGSWP